MLCVSVVKILVVLQCLQELGGGKDFYFAVRFKAKKMSVAGNDYICLTSLGASYEFVIRRVIFYDHMARLDSDNIKITTTFVSISTGPILISPTLSPLPQNVVLIPVS